MKKSSAIYLFLVSFPIILTLIVMIFMPDIVLVYLSGSGRVRFGSKYEYIPIAFVLSFVGVVCWLIAHKSKKSYQSVMTCNTIMMCVFDVMDIILLYMAYTSV